MKKLISLLVSATLALSLTACGKVSESAENNAVNSGKSNSDVKYIDDYVLKIGEPQGGLCHAPLQIAMENGYLDEEGVKWERVDFGATDIQAALGSGSIDCGFGLIGKFIQPIENGLNMVVTAGIHNGCTKLLVPPDSGINSIEDLKGKNIAVSSLAGSEALTAKRALYHAGIDISPESEEVTFSVYSPTDAPIALNNGAVDAICVPDPVATLTEQEYGLVTILDTAKTEPYASEYCCVSFVSTEIAEKHPELAAAFTRALLKASAWVSENIEETAKIQIDKEYVGGDVKNNAEILKTYSYIPSVNGAYDALVNVVSDLKTIGVLKESTDTDAMIERSFKRFDGVPDSYAVDGDSFTEINADGSATEKEVITNADCCG